ncbi:MAG: acyl carrier protein [Bacteroidota bacterium]|jgi:acyl carrier protein|nr:acyl carrier protein [Bacteroidota bacterium]
MISVEEFTYQLAGEFEDIDPNSVSPDTNYRDIKNWSSMYALIIIAFIDANFDVQLNAENLKSTQTIRDLYNIVSQKLAS